MRADLSSVAPWLLPPTENFSRRPAPDLGWLLARVCPPKNDVRAELLSRGFYFREAPRQPTLAGILARAAELLASAPSLEGAVEAAVHEIVLLYARPAFDISHSEPRWPSTVFVSVPARPGELSALRAIENIIHEAMHLRLTIAEQTTPLVADMAVKMNSPWRQEPRFVQGVLHGLFVFQCIADFFGVSALSHCLGPEGHEYIERRRAEITQEVLCIDYDRLEAGLTPKGRKLVAALRQMLP